MQGRILIVDDEKNIRRALRMVLEGAGLAVEEAQSAEDGLAMLESADADIDLVILDVRLPGMSGLEALERIRGNPVTARLPVLMISGHASVADAMAAVQKGATDFFEKPVDRDLVTSRVRNALRAWLLEKEVERLRNEARSRFDMIGQSAAMRTLFAQIEKVGPTNGRVLITGESGTGKELVARALHRVSPRADKPFVKVNCAAIPAELIESELFGYERGAFTGASQRKKGMFELANGGTLFLDEIGDMSASAQAKVLRALQSGEITRVGSEQTIAVDVRILAATNRVLEEDVAEGRFREDLFFRLNVLPLHTPPLRDRCEDIPVLVRAFLRDFSKENGFKEKAIDQDVLDALAERPWPGNVRELRNVVERMVILADDVITLDDIPDEGRLTHQARLEAARSTQGEAPDHAPARESAPTATLTLAADDRPTLKEYRERAERGYIVSTLDGCQWNISQAALLLGVERTNLHKKMRAYGIRRGAP